MESPEGNGETMNITIQEIEQLQDHVSKAVVAKLEPLVGKVANLERDQVTLKLEVGKLKANQAKALIGYSVLVSGVTAGLSHFWNRLTR